MRPLKFRAWNKKEGMFIPYFHGTLGNVVENESIYYSKEAFEKDMSTDGFGDYPTTLMQFTGIKDKNGKEIYEGDILKYRFEDKEEINSLSTGIVEVIWSDLSLGFRVTDHDEHYTFEIWDDPEMWEFEVIGNIYENKELLK